MTNSVANHFVPLVEDIMGLLQLPGGNVLGQFMKNLLGKRVAIARDILIEEIRSGEEQLCNVDEADEIVAIIYRYMRAAQEGDARLNLRLLAQVIAGQKRQGLLSANEFLYYANIISSLRREEIILLGTMYRLAKSSSPKAHPLQNRVAEELVPQIFDTQEYFVATMGALLRTGLITAVSGWGSLIYNPTPLMDKFAQFSSFEEALEKEPD